MIDPKPFESHCSANVGTGLGFCLHGFQQNYGCRFGAIKKCGCGEYFSTVPNCLKDELQNKDTVDFNRVRELEVTNNDT